jgi:hypothetical protein
VAATSRHTDALTHALNSKDQRTLKRAIRETEARLEPDEELLAVLSGVRRLIRNLVVVTDRRLLLSATRWYWFYPATNVREVRYDEIQNVSMRGHTWGCGLALDSQTGRTSVDLYSQQRVTPVAALVRKRCGIA